MIYDFTKIDSWTAGPPQGLWRICIWYRRVKPECMYKKKCSDTYWCGYCEFPDEWYFTEMYKSEWMEVCGRASHKINTGDEFILNKDCSIDFGGRVTMYDNNEYKLMRYTNESLTIKIIKI